MKKFHDTWFKPNKATLIIVGDTMLKEIRPKLEKRFGGWKSGDVPSKNINRVEQQRKPVVYLIDRPDSLQSVILAGHVAPPKLNPDEIKLHRGDEHRAGSLVRQTTDQASVFGIRCNALVRTGDLRGTHLWQNRQVFPYS